MFAFICSIILVLLASSIFDMASSYHIRSEKDVMMYLNRFGYIDSEDMEKGMKMSEMSPKIMEFQEMCSLNMTGKLNEDTIDMMNTPRCGNKDMKAVVVRTKRGTRVKRYTLHTSARRWKKKELKYKIHKFSNRMGLEISEDQALLAIKRAFKLWSEVTNLDFYHTPKAKEVDIELSFTMRKHHDSFPFDGPGKTLAHAFPPGPGLGGDVHFEDEEKWRVNSPVGTDVLFVAVHEIGHALGLSHSKVKGSIMQAFYPGYQPNLGLHKDDILGIQALYGKREIKVPSSTVAPLTTESPSSSTTTSAPENCRCICLNDTNANNEVLSDWHNKKPQDDRNREKSPKKWHNPQSSELCHDPSIDAVVNLEDQIFVFKGKFVYKLSSDGAGVLKGFPKRISNVFRGLQVDNIQAAFSRSNGKLYVFKGKKYWRLTKFKVDKGYPKIIQIHFKGIPSNVDSAFVLRENFYFTKGNKYWRFDPRHKPHVRAIYPLPLKTLGLPGSGVNGAFQAPHGPIYFFEEFSYWRLDLRTFRVAEENPPYPRSSRLMWFGCTAYTPELSNL